MSAIQEQLGLDQSFITQLIVFAALFFLLTRIYFRPFLKLFEARHQRTVADREAAEQLLLQAQSKWDEYQHRLAEERATARHAYEGVLAEARKEESAILSKAREEAKRITSETAEALNQQRDQLKKQLEVDVEILARSISERLISRKV